MVAQKKKKQTKKVTAPQVTAEITVKLSNVINLSKKSFRLLWEHKKLFGGIVAIYGLLNIVFVSGLGASVDISSIRAQLGNTLAGNITAYTQLLGSSTSAPSQAASVYQLVLIVIVSLAVIWALRQVYAKQTVRVRDAYYNGMYPLVPFILVLVVIGLQLLPMVIGSSLYQTVVANGIASQAVEIISWLIVTLLLSALSLYFITGSLFALFIVTLPDMTPRRALKLSAQLTEGRRPRVLVRLLFLPLLLGVVSVVIVLPLLFISPVLAQITMLCLGPVLLAMAYSYIYLLYRELMGE